MTEPETKQRFFYKEPENVESIVPGEQKLRESIETSELAIAGPIKGEHDKTHDAGNYVLTPVVTVTRNEEIKNGVFVTTKPSAYPVIKSDVPKQPQAIRRMGDNKDVDAKKTRIPKLRFRQAVNRVRKEMRSSDGEKVPPYQRRSSIPRLKRVLSIEKEKSNNKEPSPVEDEFDKIYDEAVTVPVSLDENILNTEIDDPVKIEHSFEEIIHAYDENDIPSKDVEKPKHSKIPMLKRKSQHEIEVPKSYGKINNNNIPAERLKVQDVINRYSKIHNEETKPNNRIPTRTHIPKLSKDSNNCVENKNNYIVEEISSPMIYNVKEMDVSNSPIQHVITNSTPNVSYNTIDFFEEKAPIYNEIVELLPVREISEVEIKSEQENASIKPVKVASIKEFNMVTENLMKNTEYSIEYNMKDEEEDTERINISNVTNTFDNSVNTCDEVKEEIIVEQINLDYDKHDDDNLDEDILIKGKVSKMIRQLSSNLEHKDVKPILDEDVPKPKSVLTKIAMFEQSSPSSTFPKTQTENKTPISSVVRIDEENVHKPHIVNGKLKTPDENNENHNKNPNSTMYEENNNIVHNIICEEFNVPPLTVVDKILETEDIIFENQPVQNKFLLNEATIQNEQYFPNNLIQHHKDEIELEAAETYRIEYAHPVNSIESIPMENDSKLNQIRILDNKEDVVYVNYESNKIENSETKKYNNGLYKSHNELDSYNTEPQLLEYEGLSSKNIDSKNTNVDLKRLRTTSEHIRTEKVKSVADLELGDAVKGKVHELIYRMNSNERLNVEKKEVISAKERPRKKSVSEKIALFEGKLAVAKITSETKSPPKRSTKPQQPGPIVLQDDEVEVKIAELKAAKIKYGCTQVNKTVVLANSEEMPAIAVGTALLDPKMTVHIVSAAIDLGYRAIDTAYIYGSEKEVGEAIKKKIEDGTVKREELFIMSKLWSTYHRTDLVEVACRKSLETMGLDYFDLYMIHNPMSFKEGPDPIPKIANVLQYSEHDFLDAWFGMEQLVTKQLVKSIGVSNFNAAQLQRLLDKARIKPVVNQVECHPYLTQQKLDQFCSENNIKLSCFGVLGSKGTPLEYKGSNNPVLDDPLVQVMAAGLNVTPAQLLISYQVELGHGAVVKASTSARLHENLLALENSLSDGQLDALNALNKNRRTFTFKGMGDTHKNYPFKAQF